MFRGGGPKVELAPVQQAMGRSVNRRGFFGEILVGMTAGATGGLAVTGSLLGISRGMDWWDARKRAEAVANQPPSPVSPPATPTTEPTYVLTPEVRSEFVNHVRALRGVINDAIQPKFFDNSFFREKIQGSDNDLAQFVRQGSVKNASGMSWRTGFSSNRGGALVEATIDISYLYSDKPTTVAQYAIRANLVNSGIPELVPFLDENSSQLRPNADSLYGAANTFFALPSKIFIGEVYKEPSFASEVVGMIIKSGNPEETRSSALSLRLQTDGQAFLFVIPSVEGLIY